MINPTYYDAKNFKPSCVDGLFIPMDVEDLASLSPAFCPTPTKRQAPKMMIAITKTRRLPSLGIGVYCQDKSSRIVFSSLPVTNKKVEDVLSDILKYKKLSHDHVKIYQPKISNWYIKSKPVFK